MLSRVADGGVWCSSGATAKDHAAVLSLSGPRCRARGGFLPSGIFRYLGSSWLACLCLLCACGGMVGADEVPPLTEPCAPLVDLGACETVTLGLANGITDPCSWRVGRQVWDPQLLTVAVDCRVMSGGRCWDIENHPNESAFVLRFSGACCKRLERGGVARIDVGIGCPGGS